MKYFITILASSFVLCSAMAQTAEENTAPETNDVQKVTVTGDRVSLRALPSLNGDLLDRAMRGDELIYYRETNGWVAVQAPDSMDVWTSGEYIENSTVLPEKLNVRSGPSLNYPVVAVVYKGDSVDVRSEFNGWYKIAPPDQCVIWISADYTDRVNPPKEVVEESPEKIEEEQVIEEEETPEVIEEVTPEKMEPEEETEPEETHPTIQLNLDESREQAVRVSVPGVLRRASPGLFKLVLIEGKMEETICLIRGRESQLEQYLNRFILITGPRFWIVDSYLPVIQPEEIVLEPLISE